MIAHGYEKKDTVSSLWVHRAYFNSSLVTPDKKSYTLFTWTFIIPMPNAAIVEPFMPFIALVSMGVSSTKSPLYREHDEVAAESR